MSFSSLKELSNFRLSASGLLKFSAYGFGGKMGHDSPDAFSENYRRLAASNHVPTFLASLKKASGS